ncbi:MAG: hypothetical protein ACM3MK_02150 [Chitinophagales bacterium]
MYQHIIRPLFLKAGKTSKGNIKFTVPTINPGERHLLAIIVEANLMSDE